MRALLGIVLASLALPSLAAAEAGTTSVSVTTDASGDKTAYTSEFNGQQEIDDNPPRRSDRVATLHAVLRGNSTLRDQVRAIIHKHGWIGDRPPSSDLERNASLDWLGGGNGELPIELADAGDPFGPAVAYGLNGWEIDETGSTRRDILIALAEANGVQVRQLGLQTNPTKLVWWLESQATFAAGIAQLGYAQRVVTP